MYDRCNINSEHETVQSVSIMDIKRAKQSKNKQLNESCTSSNKQSAIYIENTVTYVLSNQICSNNDRTSIVKLTLLHRAR